jgi:UDP:flavonoid glycosyltransferase YjiC (YdhE family)
MASIVFLPVPETGHLLPTFKLAKGLRSRGHRISYLGFQDFASAVRLENFAFIPIFERLYPVGFLRKHALKRQPNLSTISAYAARQADSLDLDQELCRIISRFRPDLFLIDNLFPEIALMLNRKGVPFVLLNTQLFNLWETDPEYAALLPAPELILSPRAFDFPREQRRKAAYNVEASIDLDRQEVYFSWDMLDPSKQVVYCALGTMSHIVGDERQFLQTVIDAMRINPDRQLILSMGAHLSSDSFHDVPPNVILVNQAPQLAVLKRASMMITHGGFNTVKECIAFGVPMLVFPTFGDTAAVAARVVYHRLGFRANIHNASATDISNMMRRVDEDASIRERIAAMRDQFRAIEQSGIGVAFIESFLSNARRAIACSGSVPALNSCA